MNGSDNETPIDRLFFEDVATALDFWVGLTTERLTAANADTALGEDSAALLALREALKGVSTQDVEAVLRRSFGGLVHSLLVVLDGGTKMAERGRLHLVDDSGASLGEGLHERFYDHLFETGRMK